MARSSSPIANNGSSTEQRRLLRARRSSKRVTAFSPEALRGATLPGAEPEHPAGVVAAATAPKRDSTLFDETLAVHAGEKMGKNGSMDTDSIATPIVSGTTHWFKNSDDLIAFKEGRRHSFEYGRYGNPTVKVLEDKISALERAESTLVTSSGMNAIVATLLALVQPGAGHVVTTTECYSEARAFIRDKLSKMGIKVTFVELNDMDMLKAVLDQGEVTLFYTDCPTNPHLKCIDIKLVAELCHRKGALVCIDSTLASPINQKPLTLGADIVVHSATKYIAGHHDVIAGCISGSQALISRIRAWHHDLGGAISPDAAYMIIRGLKTMALRVETQNRTSLRMARLLENHPKIERVYYPGLLSSPWHDIAKSQMTGFGGVISFEVASDLHGVMRFIDALEIPFIATSLGGCESLVQQPAVMSFWGQSEEEKSKNGIKDNLVRFSFGIEKFEDLRDDIIQALEKI
ncbi:probable cystathionine gamma-synthase 2 [Hordeum vulgare subsp. vulgare]|uniref:plant cystathionine gamma-synthase n=1 Tax=Hordeum vulgare subsp. vulgare TaxID=112509 RepID=F2DE63_HORVV|nr:probable cystathionine gamma-synthase 2 [Hordeum vulgare subsp. vulgare]XP_044969293.1 probable cystathionine gamma-synthase 2 [Hordeum vulgare subsp. vulgare]XP_044969294.1 probable cystathionine gamma-synthase 2 [Hordeum vulgare subsp. vulgare]XP_044969295.1 probable cystathionine gamma-synthase 2 [Hordeum vulgare subsp. vulgare]XP_044969296.1 probable cystathionine gamma-synthase 2 [Hordeum vulgare subsp. vulgare]XP_044969297.1 probable cystathionine gamma-synthase 2 [Hordeum vulgare sub